MTLDGLLEEHPHDAMAFINRMLKVGESVNLPDSKERAVCLAALYAQLLLIGYRDCESATPSVSCRLPEDHPLPESCA